MDLLFALAEWHAFAKMRLHTERTLILFDQNIKTLGEALRRFESITCAHYDTKELPKEVAARGRRQAAAASKHQNQTKKGKARATEVPAIPVGAPRKKHFVLNTYKSHALGHAPAVIREVGPLDMPSTQRVRNFQFL